MGDVVCEACGVRAECLAYALADDHLQGVWGRTSDQERRVLSMSIASALDFELLSHFDTDEPVPDLVASGKPRVRRDCDHRRRSAPRFTDLVTTTKIRTWVYGQRVVHAA